MDVEKVILTNKLAYADRLCRDWQAEAADLRALVDELRRENAALRAGGNPPAPPPPAPGDPREVP